MGDKICLLFIPSPCNFPNASVGNTSVLRSLAISFLVVTHHLRNLKSIVLCDWRQGSSNAYWCINEKKTLSLLCFCFPSFVHKSILGDLQAVWYWCSAEYSLWLSQQHHGSVQFLATAKATKKMPENKSTDLTEMPVLQKENEKQTMTPLQWKGRIKQKKGWANM